MDNGGLGFQGKILAGLVTLLVGAISGAVSIGYNTMSRVGVLENLCAGQGIRLTHVEQALESTGHRLERMSDGVALVYILDNQLEMVIGPQWKPVSRWAPRDVEPYALGAGPSRLPWRGRP